MCISDIPSPVFDSVSILSTQSESVLIHDGPIALCIARCQRVCEFSPCWSVESSCYYFQSDLSFQCKEPVLMFVASPQLHRPKSTIVFHYPVYKNRSSTSVIFCLQHSVRFEKKMGFVQKHFTLFGKCNGLIYNIPIYPKQTSNVK